MSIDIFASINGAIELAKKLSSASTEIDKADLKMKIAELTEQLVNAKDGIMDLREQNNSLGEENKQLKEFLNAKSGLVKYQDFHYRKNENGERESEPVCPRCMEADNRLITLHHNRELAEWDRICPQCKSDFTVDKSARDIARTPHRVSSDFDPCDG